MADKLPYDEIRALYTEVDRAYNMPWAIAVLIISISVLLAALLCVAALRIGS